LILLFVNTLFTKKQKSNNYLVLKTSFRFAFLKRLLLALSAIAPALLYLLHPCSRRQLLLHCSTSCIHAVVGNCSCIALPPASMQSSAIAPALLYLLHPCSRRQLLLHCSTSCIHAVVGNCSCIALPPASMQSSAIAPWAQTRHIVTRHLQI